jgi:adenylosuccinate lyase
MEQLLAISPIDGRYKDITYPLHSYFSEYALFKYRLKVEIEYFIELCKTIPDLSDFSNDNFNVLRNIYINFTPLDCQEIKKIECDTKHDIKALEYFIQYKFRKLNMSKYNSFIHFGLTSQDINTSSLMLGIKESLAEVIVPEIINVKTILDNLSSIWKDIPMLSRTHGQPATPTTVGKELQVFAYRLTNEIKNLEKTIFYTKFGGAVGNFSAHLAAYPDINWFEFADKLINRLGLVRHKYTTQISNYDEISYILDSLKRINCIILDLNQDIWLYISNGYFKQKINKNEVGSSTMPHKVNPINFENSEGNLIISNSLIEGISRKIPISRLQRDLTDSTILRNIGSVFAFSLIGYTSTIKGLNKLEINKKIIKKDLESNFVVISEALQTILRRERINNAYEIFKDFTRNVGDVVDKNAILDFIDNLDIQKSIKDELVAVSTDFL